MTGFELVFITDPALSDKELESLQKNIKMSLSKSEGKLVHEYVWGRRRLAYEIEGNDFGVYHTCLLYTSPSPRDATLSRMPSSA